MFITFPISKDCHCIRFVFATHIMLQLVYGIASALHLEVDLHISRLSINIGNINHCEVNMIVSLTCRLNI